MNRVDVHTRVLEVGVNTVVNTLRNILHLNPVEALMVLQMAAQHVEKESGVKIDVNAFIPDKKESN